MQVEIMRGVSGSGKSTRAKELLKEFFETNPDGQALICSADDFFMNHATGNYEFNSKLLSQAHAWCRGKFTACLELGLDLVILDNTNTQYWEFQPYVELAKEFGYKVNLNRVGKLDDSSLKTYANRNKHGVPLEVIQKQAKRFED